MYSYTILLSTYVVFVSLTLFPRYGSVLGGTAVQVFGPCFDEFVNHRIYCSFDEIEVQAIHVNTDSIICISPTLTSLGRIDFAIYIENVKAEFQKSTFYSCKIIHIWYTPATT